MVLANGMAMGMHGMGFGFGFLNLIGTILFFVFLVWVFRFAVRGVRTSGRAPWDWRGPGRHGPWGDHSGYQNDSDNAMKTARDRLAKNEISPEEFETLKRSLKREQESQQAPRSDSALATARLRFAQGEMSADEFEAVKKALQN
ncbi:hypothetical protein BH24DEI2_BH24DEI2_21990 [soil metagenome]